MSETPQVEQLSGPLNAQKSQAGAINFNCTRLLYNVFMEITYSQARRSLAKLLERAAQGERITITRRGRPVAELGPTQARPRLDLSRLEAVRAEVGGTKTENGVLLARQHERY